jgi:tetratricopeptide (TPR) repeat protein
VHLPLGLTSALETANCVLFLGAGIGYHLTDPQGNHAPTADQLANELAQEFGIDTGGSTDLALIAQIVEQRHGRPKLNGFLVQRLSELEPDGELRWLLSLTWKAIYTTNYDSGVERCYALNPDPTQRPVVISSNSEVSPWDPRFDVPIFHLHGSIATDVGNASILITQDDYSRFQTRRRMLFEQFRLEYANTTILYVGYSNRDPNWRMVTADLRAEYSPSTPPRSYRLSPGITPLEAEALAALNIEILEGRIPDFRVAYELTFGDLRVEPHRLDSLKSGVPQGLHQIFDEAPAAVSRLLNSWEYVSQAAFEGVANTRDFYRGDRANWALLGQGINFKRDLEEILHDQLYDFSTDIGQKHRQDIVLGPAGYGMTTLLKATAAWFARERMGSILVLRDGMFPQLGDMEFAVTSLPSPVIFVVDNAADHLRNLEEAVPRLKQLANPSFLLMGERMNEWRQAHPTLRPNEYELEPLSDDEIYRLLTSLASTNNLGRLSDLSEQLQFAAIKNRNRQELLVTMREVTEGEGFDAIVENEYYGIGSEKSRWLYGLICAFSRVQALARDSLCMSVADMPTGDFLELIRTELAGIIFWQDVDLARGLQALRARHRVIAEIVWERCLDRLQREDLLLTAINALNLAFGIDSKAFEAFTRDEIAVDSLQTLEAKTRFFEDAARKDPNNIYVRQHYARMLRREGRNELALSQIDSAIKLAPRTRVLEHTRGVILRDLSHDKDPNVGRRRMAQSEASFRRCLTLMERDEYSFQSLAELYLDWANRTDISDTESVLYATKAQDVVLSGLAVARAKDGLYIVDSNIERFFGDTQKRIDALRLAWVEAPQNSVVPYLLGNILRNEGQYLEAIDVLERGLAQNPEDPNLSRVYGLALYESGATLDKAVAPLRLTSVTGERDPRFVAVLGGMLTLMEDREASRQVWDRSSKRKFPARDYNAVNFVPRPSGSRVLLHGRVTEVKSGFSFISTHGQMDYFAPGRSYSGLFLRRGQEVSFKPSFSARGSIAEEVSFVS